MLYAGIQRFQWTSFLVSLAALTSAQPAMQAFPPDVQDALNKAHQFELTYRAHSSVTTDSFYEVPPGSANTAPGTLLKHEKDTNTSLYTLAPNLSLSRFMYQSETSNGTLVPVSGYVLWPYIAKPHDDGYPMIVWAHGTSGIHPECAPSNVQNLWHHFQAPYQFALNGYAVVATDYAGLGVGVDANGNSIPHEYITAPAQANDVLNSIPAARQAFPELSADFCIAGSSEGGSAAWSCAEKLVDRPVSGHLGTVPLSPLTRLVDLPHTEPILPLLVLMMMPALVAENPGFSPSEILDETGLKSLDFYNEAQGCNSILFNLPVTPDNLIQGWQDNPVIQKYQQVAAVGKKPISGPMLIATGGADPIIFNPTVTTTVNETAKMFPEAQLDYYLLPDVSHAPAMYAGWQMYSAWIADLFAGKKVAPGLRTHAVNPIRPMSVQQTEANWYIQNFTGSWQQT